MHGSNDINDGTIPELGYDHRDVNLKAIVFWMSIFSAFVVVSILTIQFFAYPFFTPDWKKLEKQVPAFVTAPRTPPFPQVQADPKLDMEVFKASEERQHEAMNKAKEALAARGLAGITTNTEHAEGKSFPGSGDYAGVDHKAKPTEAEGEHEAEHAGGEH
ncbi:hypothetical protein [Armatimonas rosea]|uniref:Uncharacterized protein n=1 Tax=Armatimonas rosea TaxID=685828 RepID=A0A7W9W7G9_ARMRO|nr:hypothetical protein [Armatimonas rosea]MBB6051075.1 hypothetical protein [Armatimonas rosea]